MVSDASFYSSFFLKIKQLFKNVKKILSLIVGLDVLHAQPLSKGCVCDTKNSVHLCI